MAKVASPSPRLFRGDHNDAFGTDMALPASSLNRGRTQWHVVSAAEVQTTIQQLWISTKSITRSSCAFVQHTVGLHHDGWSADVADAVAGEAGTMAKLNPVPLAQRPWPWSDRRHADRCRRSRDAESASRF